METSTVASPMFIGMLSILFSSDTEDGHSQTEIKEMHDHYVNILLANIFAQGSSAYFCVSLTGRLSVSLDETNWTTYFKHVSL